VGMQAMTKLHTVGYREDDVYLHCAPLFHIGGLSSMIAMLAVGATQVSQKPGCTMSFQHDTSWLLRK